MFESILKDYDKNKKVLEKQEEQLRRQLAILAEPMTKKVLQGVNSNIQVLHANEQIIERECRQLLRETINLQKEAQNWSNLYNSLNETLKKAGDIVNFAQVIENELQELVDG